MSQQALSPLNTVDLAGSLNPLFPVNLRPCRGALDNAIEYRNIMLLGSQGSGKTTTAQSIALTLQSRYTNVSFFLQIAGIDWLLKQGTRQRAKCWLLVAEDITLAKVPNKDLNAFFQVRHLIQEHTGIREGMAVTVLNSHTFHGLNKNLRDTFNALIIKSVPTNPYDRGILKRYFNPWLLDQFEKGWAIDKALVWTPAHNHGSLVTVKAPEQDAIENTIVNRSILSRLFSLKGR